MVADVGVVLPAGGAGARLGGEAKQFRRLGDAPVVVQTLRAFALHPEVGPAVIAVPAGEEAATAAMLAEFGAEAAVVAGGPSRQDSVVNGVAALPEAVRLVLVHDAVRPFVSHEVISRVVGGVRESGAAAAAVPVADTLRRGAGSTFRETVSRDGVWAMQTPQGARRDWLEAAASGGTPATDEVGLLQSVGHEVRIVEGDTRNLKITRPSDWSLALALWPTWQGAERRE